MKQTTNSPLIYGDMTVLSAYRTNRSDGGSLIVGGVMNTVEETFGLGCNLHKVTLAMIEQDEDVTLDENGETVSDLAKILEWEGVPV